MPKPQRIAIHGWSKDRISDLRWRRALTVLDVSMFLGGVLLILLALGGHHRIFVLGGLGLWLSGFVGLKLGLGKG